MGRFLAMAKKTEYYPKNRFAADGSVNNSESRRPFWETKRHRRFLLKDSILFLSRYLYSGITSAFQAEYGCSIQPYRSVVSLTPIEG